MGSAESKVEKDQTKEEEEVESHQEAVEDDRQQEDSNKEDSEDSDEQSEQEIEEDEDNIDKKVKLTKSGKRIVDVFSELEMMETIPGMFSLPISPLSSNFTSYLPFLLLCMYLTSHLPLPLLLL